MVKPFLDYNAQLQKLQNRGCQVDDPTFALATLARVNYYRFSAYFLPFKDKDGNYKHGTTFTTVYHTYEFDRKLRSILFAALASVKHHIENYDKQFPLWVMSELFTFGMLSRFYANLNTQDQKHLARKLCTESNETLKNWLRCCTILRNICAHHGRIYYRLFSIAPVGFKVFNRHDQRRLYVMLLVLKNLYPDKKAQI